MANAVIGR